MNSLLHITHAKTSTSSGWPSAAPGAGARGRTAMPTSTSYAPADTRPAQRLSEAHTYSVPVVRELPRPVPHGLGSTAW